MQLFGDTVGAVLRAASTITPASNNFMSAVPIPNRVRCCLIGLTLLATISAGAQQNVPPPAATESGQLSLDQVLAKLQENNAHRAAALEQFEGTRIYRMEYRGFPSDRDAEMVVKVSFHAPDSKQFSVVSETGSKFVIDHVFKKLLESEQEAWEGDNRQRVALTRQNYDFELAGYQTSADGGQYVLTLLPKTKNKFLCRGKIWIDAKDFAVVRMEGEPGKNPSMWIKKTDIQHSYKKVDGFWLPAENHTESLIRLGGKATLSILYQDYKIVKATSPDSATASPKGNGSALDGPNQDSLWANRLIGIGPR